MERTHLKAENVFLCEHWTKGAKEYFSSLFFYLFQCIGNISSALYKFSRFTGSQEFCQIFSLHTHTRRLFAGHLFNENAWERNIVFFSVFARVIC